MGSSKEYHDRRGVSVRRIHRADALEERAGVARVIRGGTQLALGCGDPRRIRRCGLVEERGETRHVHRAGHRVRASLGVGRRLEVLRTYRGSWRRTRQVMGGRSWSGHSRFI